MAKRFAADPNTTMIQLANGGGLHPARNVVGGDFLHLVRFGIRSANDPIVRDSNRSLATCVSRENLADHPRRGGNHCLVNG